MPAIDTNALKVAIKDIESPESLEKFTAYVRRAKNYIEKIRPFTGCVEEVTVYRKIVEDALAELNVSSADLMFHHKLSSTIKRGLYDILAQHGLCLEEYSEILFTFLTDMVLKARPIKVPSSVVSIHSRSNPLKQSCLVYCNVLHNDMLFPDRFQELMNLCTYLCEHPK